MSIVRKQFEDRIPRWTRRLANVPKDWSALLLTLGSSQRCGLLTGRQAAGVGGVEQKDQAMGCRYGSSATDARGPFRLGLGRGLLAGRQAAGFSVER